MADRKVTVLNPAGYQEQLPDSDNLLIAATPTASTHAVNKLYVDTGLSNLDVTLDLQEVTDAGNTTTNDITIGDISLNADGSASFAGDVGIGTVAPNYPLDVVGYIQSSIGFRAGQYTILSEAGNETSFGNSAYYGVSFKTNNATRMKITNAGNVEIGGNTPSILLNQDGSGEFAGKVNSGDWDGTGGSGVGSSLSFAGGLFARRAAGSNSEKLLFAGWNGLNQVAKIDAAGGAKFAGSILQGPEWDREVSQNQALISNGTFYARRAAPASPLFRGYAGTNPGDDSDLTIELFANGSATFAGDVTANKLIGDIDCGEY